MWVIPLFVMHRCLGFKVEHASLVVMAIICVVKMFQCWRNGNCNKLEGLSSWVKHFRDPLKLVLSLKWSESLEPVEKIFIEVYLLTLPCKLDRFIATEKMFTAVKRCSLPKSACIFNRKKFYYFVILKQSRHSLFRDQCYKHNYICNLQCRISLGPIS